MLDRLLGSVSDLFEEGNETESDSEPRQEVDIDDIDDLFKTAKEARMPLERYWMENLAFYMGKQWLIWSDESKALEIPDLPEWRVLYTGNLIQPNIRTEYAKLIQQRPTARVKPMSDTPDDVKRARTNNNALDYLWKPTGSEDAKNQSMLWALILGTGIVKGYWDKSKGPVIQDPARGINLPIGDIHVISCSPLELYPEPLAKTIAECNYVFHSKLRTAEYVWERYHIKVTDEEYADEDHLEGRIAQITGQGTGAKVKGVLLNEFWQRPTSKYPEGRLVTKAGTTLLEAIANPNNKWKIPFASWQHIPVPGRFWGSSIIDQLKDPQRNYNKSRSQVIENRNLMGRPKYLVPIGSMPAGKEITSAPGEIIDYIPIAGQKPEILPVAPIGEQFWRDQDTSMKEIRAISGINEVSNAEVPGQVRAYRAIAALQEQDDARMIPAAMNFEAAVAELEKGKLSLMRQFYTEQRVARVMGEGNRTEVIYFSQEDIMDDADIQVDAGSSMPMTKSAKLAIMGDLWDRGIMRDPRAYAKVVEFGEIEGVFAEIDRDTAQAERENDKLKSPQTAPTGLDPNGQGQPVQVQAHDYDNHIIHIETHNSFRKSEEFEQLDESIHQAFEMHVEEHKNFMMMQQMQQAALASQQGPLGSTSTGGRDEGGAVKQAEAPNSGGQ